MNKLFILFLFCTMCVSCNKSSNDPEVLYTDWNLKNKLYFNQMKDSAGYILYNIPANQGGYSYYYKIISQGTQTEGPFPDTAKVLINYRGKLITGSIFNETYYNNSVLNDNTATPVWISMYSLIFGLKINLTQMKIGEIRRIILPQELGQGTNNTNPQIPPFSTTIWDVQLNQLIN